MDVTKKLYMDASNTLNDTADAMLDMDVKELGIDLHYTDLDIMNALLIFNHVTSNRMIHNMIKSKKRMKDWQNISEQMWYRLRDYVKEACGFDPSTFYSDKDNENVPHQTTKSNKK